MITYATLSRPLAAVRDAVEVYAGLARIGLDLVAMRLRPPPAPPTEGILEERIRDIADDLLGLQPADVPLIELLDAIERHASNKRTAAVRSEIFLDRTYKGGKIVAYGLLSVEERAQAMGEGRVLLLPSGAYVYVPGEP